MNECDRVRVTIFFEFQNEWQARLTGQKVHVVSSSEQFRATRKRQQDDCGGRVRRMMKEIR